MKLASLWFKIFMSGSRASIVAHVETDNRHFSERIFTKRSSDCSVIKWFSKKTEWYSGVTCQPRGTKTLMKLKWTHFKGELHQVLT